MEQSETSRLAEYQATQAAYLHYDSFRWQAGSLVIAGVFIFWGLLINSNNPPPARLVGIVGVLITLLMSIWILFAHHYRQILLCKLNRVHELEELLCMEQHLRFIIISKTKRKYKIFGPKGHNLDIAIYIITSIGGSILCLSRTDPNIWLLFPAPIVIIVLLWVIVNERKIFKQLDLPIDN